ncbi:MAG: hypothetical protein ACI8RZ_006896, partial [Myxococcota bacterium]
MQTDVHRAAKQQGLEECIFQATETFVTTQGAAGYPWSIDLCALSGRPEEMCHAHAILRLANSAPRSAADAPGWANAAVSAEAISAAWAEDDPAFGARMVDQFWSQAIIVVYQNNPPAGGALLALTPPEATPHIRATAALQLIQAEGPGGANLSARVDRLAAYLAGTTPLSRSRPVNAASRVPNA